MRCETCKHYDSEEHYCTYIICAPGYCDEPLPCEKEKKVYKITNTYTINKLTEARDLIVKEYEWCYDGYSPVSKKLETIIKKIDRLLATETTEDIKDWVPEPVFEEKDR